MYTSRKTRQQLQLLRDEALDAYLNREDFQYNMNADSLYQQYKDRYLELGKNAMTDTMGQASALTGGYGSSYAQQVGQQAYQDYMQKLNDVVPELYQLAYDRYRDRSERLYENYQNWAALEQQAADQEQLEQERKNSDQGNHDQNPYEGLVDYWAWYATLQGKGERARYDDPSTIIKYDNGAVSTGNIMRMQTAIGREATGMWTWDDRKKAGKMTADQAWAAYQKGQLQNFASPGMGDMGLPNSKVRIMEWVLGQPEDGYWSEADKKAAGGLSQFEAWEAYLQRKL